MANVLWGIPRDRGSAFDISKGTYLRMGTYSDDPRLNMDERVVLPYEYLQDVKTDDRDQALEGSEGILFSTRGSYVVETEKQGVMEFGAGISEHVTGTGNDLGTTIHDGNISVSVLKGDINITGTSSFEVTAASDDVVLKALNGTLVTRAKKINKITTGSYIKRVHAKSSTEVSGTNTNINVGANLKMIAATEFSLSISSVRLYPMMTMSLALVPISVSLFAFNWTRLSEDFLSTDTLHCYLYLEYRAVQLDTWTVKTGSSMSLKRARTYRYKNIKWCLKSATVQTYRGLLTTVPGLAPQKRERGYSWSDYW
ncbi:hypothetical protein [uncultured Roseibium sp.]|uniref:hypothetical protein n=1 Tax=uncultured Roseibium sp. TaxID=1936171 RepID=UPI002628CB45|nr:hypothetical protein [uncultured Roseibium sp.]